MLTRRVDPCVVRCEWQARGKRRGSVRQCRASWRSVKSQRSLYIIDTQRTDHVEIHRSQAIEIFRTQEGRLKQCLLASELESAQQVILGRCKYRPTFFLRQADDRDAVDGEHERGEAGVDGRKATNGVNDARLECWGMRDLEKRIDIVEIDLPQLEDLRRRRMQGREVQVRQWRAEDEILFAVAGVLPRLLDHALAHLSHVEIAVASRAMVFVFVGCGCLCYGAPYVAASG